MHAMSLAWIGRLDFEIVLDMAEQVSYSYDNFFSMELVANILFNDVRGMLHGPLLRKYDVSIIKKKKEKKESEIIF